MRNIHDIANSLTLAEKASLCSGGTFWDTTAIPSKGVPSIMMTDGPHGLRKQAGGADHLGLNDAVQATCFPTAAAIACSWDPELMRRIGAAIGEECQAENVGVILGPGANIKRSPLCGRNFEYFSEDPYLTGQMAAAHIAGVQSQGIGASLKHFAVNNQETRRMTINAEVDERTLREIYLAGFETAVKASKPWTVMCAYNQVNGEFCAQNKRLLTSILRDEWGFDGVVVSDWFATRERDDCLKAGLDLEMPTSVGVGAAKIIEQVNNGSLSINMLDKAVERILTIVFKAVDAHKQNAAYDKDAHHALACETASESIVLLKNDNNILPINNSASVAVVGAFAKSPRYQGAGSSRINASRVSIPYDEIINAASGANVTYCEGYSLDGKGDAAQMISEAVSAAKSAHVCIIFAGLPDSDDSEGKDREHVRLPDDQNALIDAVITAQPRTIVVLMNGSAVELPWADKSAGILEAYLAGQASGKAIADILFGAVNPSGKLAETFPVKLNDTPCYLNFPGDASRVEYREGIFVGYRYYDTAGIKPRFPFGFGLSYTMFEYSDITLSANEILDTDSLTVSVKVKNIGSVAGKEIVQLYVNDAESSVLRPCKELKGFVKLTLQPGETGKATFILNKRSFAFYDKALKDWRVETGLFNILIGASSEDIRLSAPVQVNTTTSVKKCFTLDSTLYDIRNEPAAAPLLQSLFSSAQGETMLGMDADAVMLSIKVRSLAALSMTPISERSVTIEQLAAMVEEMNK
ncbi:glycosyl hydrolase [Clostridia bacterium]|nr:glycosyl hydrolase [Clostridia bacterium]